MKLEQTYDPFTGEQKKFAHVVPSWKGVDKSKPLKKPKLHKFIECWKNEKWTRTSVGSTPAVNKRIYRAAREFWDVYGVHGQQEFLDWIVCVREKSGDLRSSDGRSPFDRAQETWDNLVREQSSSENVVTTSTRRVGLLGGGGCSNNVFGIDYSWSPVTFSKKTVEKTVNAIIDIAKSHRGLNPAAFAMSERQLADYMGITQQAAHNRIRTAIKHKAVYVAAPAIISRSSEFAKSAIYTMIHLCGGYENAVELAKSHHEVRKQKEQLSRIAAARQTRNAKMKQVPSGNKIKVMAAVETQPEPATPSEAVGVLAIQVLREPPENIVELATEPKETISDTASKLP